jgi:hypothetical protein
MKSKLGIILAFLTVSIVVFGQTKTTETDFRKVCSEVVNAFAKGNVKALNKYINPSTGVYVISRPGAIDMFVNQRKLDLKKSFDTKYPYKDTSAVKKHVIRYDVAPRYDCGELEWNKTGFIADSVSIYKRISDIIAFRMKNENAKFTEEEIAQKDKIEKKIRKVVYTEIAKNHGLVFYLSFIGKKWYLTVIDTTVGNCGA